MSLVRTAEDYSIRSPRTGDLLLSRLKLSGWGAVTAGVPALEQYTDGGRLWVKFTKSSELLEFFSRKEMLTGDRVAFANVVAGRVAAFTAAGGSGLSGSCEATNGTPGVNPTKDSTTDVVISYAHEKDLVAVMADVEGFLDSDNQFCDQDARFEALLRQGKREIDEHLRGRLRAYLGKDDAGRVQLAWISDPRQYAQAHALWCAGLLQRHRAGNDEALHAVALNAYFEPARDWIKTIVPDLDMDADGVVDASANVRSMTVELG